MWLWCKQKILTCSLTFTAVKPRASEVSVRIPDGREVKSLRHLEQSDSEALKIWA